MKRPLLAALAALALVVCAGCNDDPEPDFAPPESTSPAPTTPPTTSEPPEPERLSPEETVRAWVEARNITVRTGDAYDVRRLSAADCESCADSDRARRGRSTRLAGDFETTGWRVESVEPKPDSDTSGRAAGVAGVDRGRTNRSRRPTLNP